MNAVSPQPVRPTPPRSVGRRRVRTRAGAAVVLSVVALTVLLCSAGPAGADVPQGWDAKPEKVDLTRAVLVIGGSALLLGLVIIFLVYLPSLIRGDRLAPGLPTIEDEWLGGGSRSPAELAASDAADVKAGGASGRW